MRCRSRRGITFIGTEAFRALGEGDPGGARCSSCCIGGGPGSRLRKYTIGPYGRITLAMARGQAQKIFAARVDGRDPAAEKQQAKRRLVADRMEELIEAFIVQHVSRLRTAKRMERRLRMDVVGRWGNKSIHEIKKRDVIDLVTELLQRGPGAARRALKDLKTFFRWCVGRGVIDFSPADRIPNPGNGRSRDRVLEDGELADIILAGRTMGGPIGAIVEVLALTGQRRDEVTRMAWAEIDEATRTWRIPAARCKNGRLTWCTCQSRSGTLSNKCLEQRTLCSRPPAKSLFKISLARKEPLTDAQVLRAGVYMTSAVPRFPVWLGWASRLTWRIRSSTTRAARFPGWRLCTKDTSSLPNEERRLIAGDNTSPILWQQDYWQMP